MNIFQMLISNIVPIQLGTKGYYFRKRLLHKGYEVLYKRMWSNNEFFHVDYIDNLQ